MENLVEFYEIDKKSRFQEKLEKGEIDKDWIVFIQDTNEIWHNGIMYSPSIHKVITKEEFKKLESEGKLEDVFYYVIES